MGRKSTYNETSAKEVCARLSEGETLSKICRDAHMPSRDAVYDWMRANPEFEQQVARARVQGFEALAEGCLDIAARPPERTPAGTVDSGDIQQKKLEIWARLEMLKRWDPKRYGDRVEVAGDADNPLAVSLKVEFVKPNG